MRTPPFPPRRPAHLVRYIFPAAILVIFLHYIFHTTSDATHLSTSVDGSSGHSTFKVGKPVAFHGDTSANAPKGRHPIDTLIQQAETNFETVLAAQSTSPAKAAAAYRKRRGRHPPPGFKAWYEFAVKHDAIIVEEFWDQIYHDLNPFWGLDPKRIRRDAWDFEMTINVRDGKASAGSDWFWTQIWLGMIKTIEHLLPDMDLALNAMDEPRLVVPWEDIQAYLREENKSRVLLDPKDVITQVTRKLPPGLDNADYPKATDKQWDRETSPYWLIARRGCPPGSAAHTTYTMGEFEGKPKFVFENAASHQYQGYTSNYTRSTEFCHQPDLQGLEGIFIRPLTTSASKVLFPMFGGSKLATHNEILLPPPMYWSEEERFTGGDDHGSEWEAKTGNLIWRGVATGGRNTAKNWKGFQRHRFVAMVNGTKLAHVEEGSETPVNFEMPHKQYNIASQKDGKLGQWVSSFADVGVINLACDPEAVDKEDPRRCAYTDEHFEVLPLRSMSEQFRYKYLPDIDGNSFSGRYLGFLRSTSVPIKSTLWREWHDSRLFAWKHFVPMDNRFGDFYGIMEYFVGYADKIKGHDAAAEKIAMDGKAWAEKVLRKQDMQIYVLRLLLEYARVSDDQREKLGWVEDLV